MHFLRALLSITHSRSCNTKQKRRGSITMIPGTKIIKDGTKRHSKGDPRLVKVSAESKTPARQNDGKNCP